MGLSAAAGGYNCVLGAKAVSGVGRGHQKIPGNMEGSHCQMWESSGLLLHQFIRTVPFFTFPHNFVIILPAGENPSENRNPTIHC